MYRAASLPASPLPATLAVLLGLWVSLIQPGSAAEGRVIELRDGSVLMGEVVAAGNGRYRIRTPVLGEVELPESEVLAIRSAAAPAAGPVGPSAGPTDLQGALASIQRQLVGDPLLAGAIVALQSDPELQAALADPAFTQLVLSGNLVALGTDSRFLRLMANPAIQALLGQVGGQLGGQALGR